MKNKQKSRSGCRTCKVRRLRCDETKPGCRNCALKGFECPGYQQRLQWSTKYERPAAQKVNGPSNFDQLVSAASESIARPPRPAAEPSTAGDSPSSPPAPVSPTNAAASPVSTEVVPAPASPGAAKPCTDVAPVTTKKTAKKASGAATNELVLNQSVVDIPTFLIEHWFKSVCYSWSAYDSPSNPYRRLTSSLWSTSMPVFYALQAISAASLVERLPHVMKETAMAAPRLATDAIKKELVAFSSRSCGPKFPKELLLSLFCMSSSLCWMESRELGLQYVRQARAVLKCVDQSTLDEDDMELYDFFSGCLIYEEMLRSVVSDSEIDFKNMLSWPEPDHHSQLVTLNPHAWTGVSPDVLRLFGKAMALCRRSRSRWRHNPGMTYRILQGAMMDIEEARAVEEALLATDSPGREEEIPIPENITTAELHLHEATEAYRLSSLLQLYQTFPDLIATRIPSQVDGDGSVSWNAWVSPLALHVTSILEKIPPTSMRCIQPLLCLCAGSGLRLDNKVGFNNLTELPTLANDPPFSAPPALGADLEMLSLGTGMSETSLKISRARHFLMDRLDKLELSLPPKPIGVAKQLLRAVWAAYDEEIQSPRRTHWLDVMSNTGLQSLFG